MVDQYVIQCEDSLEGMFTAIYEAFVIKKETCDSWGEHIRISIGDGGNYSLFTDDITVDTDREKAGKVIDTIQKKVGFRAYYSIFAALCHFDSERATVCFRYLIRAFRVGARIEEYLSDPYVMRVMEYSRKASNEVDKLKGFLRFRDMGKFLYAQTEPKVNALPLMISHFEDRYPNEHFVIYDERRRLAAIHQAYHASVFMYDEAFHLDLSKSRDEFEVLWKQYFQTMEIRPRHNERCQNNLCPKWYRSTMIEFAKDA